MRCTDEEDAGSARRRALGAAGRGGALRRRLQAACAAALLGGCAGTSAPPAPKAPTAPSAPPAPAVPRAALPSAAVAPPAGAATRATPAAPVPGVPALAPASTARNWDEFRRQAAQRLVAANPGRTYMGVVPETLLAIPVLEVELGADGAVQQIRVLRQPRQALDTVQLAMDAVRRAAPYGDVSRLPRPWRFTEVFLFDDERRFKPRTLDD